MSRALQEMCLWKDEIAEDGIEGVLIDRLRFHGGLSVRDVAMCAGLSEKTVLKHFAHLVEKGHATWAPNDHIRPTRPLTRAETHPTEKPVASHWREHVAEDSDAQHAAEERIRKGHPEVAAVLDYLTQFGLWETGRCGWTYFHGWLDSVWDRANSCDPARFQHVDKLTITRAVFVCI